MCYLVFCCFRWGWTNYHINNIWKIPQIIEFKSCTLTFTIQIFTKFLSLSLMPKASMKQKKFVVVSLRESSSTFDKFLSALRLNRILQKVILFSVLVTFSVPDSTFSTIFWSSYSMKCFSPSKPKESKKNISFFGSMSKILHQCVPGF